MYGLEAINANNGWSMAVLGATIVFLGLVALTFAISQLHKLIDVWENRTVDKKRSAEPIAAAAGRPQHPKYCPDNIQDVAAIYEPLAAELGATFKLSALYALSQQYDFPHPHITISRLKDANILVPEGEGVFSWNRSGN